MERVHHRRVDPIGHRQSCESRSDRARCRMPVRAQRRDRSPPTRRPRNRTPPARIRSRADERSRVASSDGRPNAIRGRRTASHCDRVRPAPGTTGRPRPRSRRRPAPEPGTTAAPAPRCAAAPGEARRPTETSATARSACCSHMAKCAAISAADGSIGSMTFRFDDRPEFALGCGHVGLPALGCSIRDRRYPPGRGRWRAVLRAIGAVKYVPSWL